MKTPNVSDRGAGSHRPPNSQDEIDPNTLFRVRSHEVSVAESIAVVADLPASDLDEMPGPTQPRSTKYLILLCALLTSLSFGVTQVPLLYVFRLMTCDAYYERHPQSTDLRADGQLGPTTRAISLLSYAFSATTDATADIYVEADRCSNRAIESSTALSIAILGGSTTLFGIANLFFTSSLIKRVGIKSTLIIQVFFPALRLAIQNIGVEVWGNAGIIIIQASQILTIVGGPSGYVLCLNTFITEIVEHEARTAALGQVAGSAMFGSACGFLLGAVIADELGMPAPFRLTLVLFLCSSLYVFLVLPHIPPPTPKEDTYGKTGTSAGITRFFGPLLVFTPRKFIGHDGIVRTEYGSLLLACGVALGILATSYIPTLLQLFSTDMFGFASSANGWLIFLYSMLRGLFLTFAFPRLISLGRAWVTHNREKQSRAMIGTEAIAAERQPLLHAEPGGTERATTDPAAAHVDDKQRTENHAYQFDLIYTRASLVADGFLTLLCSLVRQSWQMYLMAAILPFSAGTGSAAKGTVLQMVGASASGAERTDALAGVSLVENMARLTTTFFFGVIFAAFASIGRIELVFTCNAAIALVGFCVLMLARFPLEGSRPVDQVDTSEPDS